MNGLQLADKELTLKVDEKVRGYLDSLAMYVRPEVDEAAAATARRMVDELNSTLSTKAATDLIAASVTQASAAADSAPAPKEYLSSEISRFRQNVASYDKTRLETLSTQLSEAERAREREREQERLRDREQRRARDAEAAYQSQLPRWERKERDMQRERAALRKEESERAERQERYASRVKMIFADPSLIFKEEFFTDRSRYLAQRRRDSEREEIADEKDRRREQEEIAAAKAKAEEEAERARAAAAAIAAALPRVSSGFSEAAVKEPVKQALAPGGTIRLELASSSTKRPLASVLSTVVADDDEDEVTQARKRRVLIPIDYSEEELAAVGMSKVEVEKRQREERNQKLLELTNSIPVEKDALFAHPVQWGLVDAALIDSKLRPWITKKIEEYLGASDDDLVSFIVRHIKGQISPAALVEELHAAFDKDAEVFVTKLWRLIIFESQARALA